MGANVNYLELSLQVDQLPMDRNQMEAIAAWLGGLGEGEMEGTEPPILLPHLCSRSFLSKNKNRLADCQPDI